MKPSYEKLMELAKPVKGETEEERNARHDAFWIQTVEIFNEDIAGDIELVDGTVIHTPRIEL